MPRLGRPGTRWPRRLFHPPSRLPLQHRPGRWNLLPRCLLRNRIRRRDGPFCDASRASERNGRLQHPYRGSGVGGRKDVSDSRAPALARQSASGAGFLLSLLVKQEVLLVHLLQSLGGQAEENLEQFGL